MFIGADLSLCIQGHQERREKDCKKKGNGGAERRGAVIGTFPFLELFELTRVQMTQGTFQPHSHNLILFSCGFHFEESVSPLFVHLCLKFPSGEMYDKRSTTNIC